MSVALSYLARINFTVPASRIGWFVKTNVLAASIQYFEFISRVWWMIYAKVIIISLPV